MNVQWALVYCTGKTRHARQYALSPIDDGDCVTFKCLGKWKLLFGLSNSIYIFNDIRYQRYIIVLNTLKKRQYHANNLSLLRLIDLNGAKHFSCEHNAIRPGESIYVWNSNIFISSSNIIKENAWFVDSYLYSIFGRFQDQSRSVVSYFLSMYNLTFRFVRVKTMFFAWSLSNVNIRIKHVSL